MLLKFLYLLEKIFFFPSRTVMSVAIFLKDLRWGIYYGYPWCCVLQFSVQRALGLRLKQGLNRGGIRIAPGRFYVPCSYHQKRHPQWRTHAEWFSEAKHEKSIRGKFMQGQNSLNNFYRSMIFRDTQLAVAMQHDIITVSLNALSADKSAGQESADRLRQQAVDLPEIHRRVLEGALIELGYS